MSILKVAKRYELILKKVATSYENPIGLTEINGIEFSIQKPFKQHDYEIYFFTNENPIRISDNMQDVRNIYNFVIDKIENYPEITPDELYRETRLFRNKMFDMEEFNEEPEGEYYQDEDY